MRPDQRELDDEIRGHVALEVKQRIDRGEDPSAARLAALASLGHVGDVRASMRRVWYGRWFDLLADARRDTAFAIRVLRKAPLFASVAIATLALSIGANAVVFGVMNGLLLRPPNVPDPESLYGIEHATEHSMYESYPDYLDLRDRNRSFETLAAFSIAQIGVDTGEQSSATWAEEVSGNYFDALRLRPYLGRFVHAADEHGPDSVPSVVLGYAYWQKAFHGDPGVVGRVIQVNKYPFTIVGVAPPAFRGVLAIGATSLFVPLVDQRQIEGQSLLDQRSRQSVFMTFGHLKLGVTPAQAAADLDAIGKDLERAYPREHGASAFVLARPGLYGNYLGQPMRAFMTGLFTLSALILLAACANLGSLFAARTSDRTKEIALRLSLGAGRLRILRQLIAESVLLSLIGGALGAWSSSELLRVLSVWRPMPKFPVAAPVEPDVRVYLFSFALALLSGVFFGLLPARQIFRTDPVRAMKDGASRVAGTRWPLRDVLVVAQIAICVVLVTASVVAVRGLGRAMSEKVGFDPQHVLLPDTDLSMARYTGNDVTAMQKRMIDTVAAIPGVTAVAAIGRPPLSASGFLAYVYDQTAADFHPSQAAAMAQKFQVSPGYFAAAKTSLVAGRDFSWHDDARAPRVAVVNAEFARRVLGGSTSAIGHHFRLRDGTLVQVVGVTEDGKYESLTEDPTPAVFFPLQQLPMSETSLVIRTEPDPGALTPQVRAALRTLDPGLPVNIETWTRMLEFKMFAPRMATLALGVMGIMGALLAVTGIFGSAAYSVSRRLKEFGIRIALGARRREIVRVALGRALLLLTCGSVIGLGLGSLSGRVLAAVVAQATPRDPLVLAVVLLMMGSLGGVATWIPARRATRVDPLTLLREE